MLAQPIVYAGTRYRSKTEVKWVRAFSRCGVQYDNKARGFNFSSVLPDHFKYCESYLPDFWLPEYKLWFEVKPSLPNIIEYRKAAILAEVTGCDVLVAPGCPGEMTTFEKRTPYSELSYIAHVLLRISGLNKSNLVSYSEDDDGLQKLPFEIPNQVLVEADMDNFQFREFTEAWTTSIARASFNYELMDSNPKKWERDDEGDNEAFYSKTKWIRVLSPSKALPRRTRPSKSQIVDLVIDEALMEKFKQLRPHSRGPEVR